MSGIFLYDLFKSFIAIACLGIVFGAFCVVALYYIESKSIRESYNNMSTPMGNALFLLQDIFEPHSKFRTEQIVWVKKRRTRAEKLVDGIPEVYYDKIFIRGIKNIENKRYYLKSRSI